MDFGIASVAGITVICYLVAQVVKATALDNKWLPILCGAAGAVDPRGAAAQLDGPVGTDDDARTAGDAFFR